MLAFAIGIGIGMLPRDAVPTDPPSPSPVPTPTLTPTTNDRVAGNWRLTHRVDLPPGWTVTSRSVATIVESTSLEAPNTGTTQAHGCNVMVWGVGEQRPPLGKGRQSVTVSDRPGYTDTPIPDGESRVTWEYRDNAWASVSCTINDDFATVRDIAERVVFTPTLMRVPFRLTWVPDGFRVRAATDWPFQHGPYTGWILEQEQEDPNGFAAIQVYTMPSETELRAGQPGTTTDVIAGYPAVLQAERGRIQLDTGKHIILLSADGHQDGQTEWPSEWIAMLTQLAESLVLAPDLGDRNTWFDAETAVP